MKTPHTKSVVSCTINGNPTQFLSDSGGTLLNALRDDVGLTGVKEGCGTGDCGACSILVEDRVTCACLIFAPEAEGTTIVTIEGLADADHLHPLQETFLEGAALQCGVCTPGFLMAAKALLDKNSDPTETEIRYALAGNLCRCTGYDKIIRAVQDAAERMRATT
jgi:carbon-monoxide dehydrogenase small subunit